MCSGFYSHLMLVYVFSELSSSPHTVIRNESIKNSRFANTIDRFHVYVGRSLSESPMWRMMMWIEMKVYVLSMSIDEVELTKQAREGASQRSRDQK